jgi:phosphopantothenoylcysteine decarboxylase/phosphopantothenate--cysteine ligase
MRCLITAGPTREYWDPVRYLSNGSSGKMGYALAEAARALGWTVELVSGPVALPAPAGVELVKVVSAAEMMEACEARFDDCDVFIAVAAVSDYRPKRRLLDKGAKHDGPMTMEFEPTADILKTMGARRRANQVLIGFAAETSDLERKAPEKLRRKHCDWIVANDVSRPEVGMESDQNAVSLWNRDGKSAEIGPLPKTEIARWILAQLFGKMD